jgi:hypothetical protein
MVAGIAEELRQLPGVRIDLVTSPEIRAANTVA